MFRIMHQMKFVVKPPTRTTTSTGRPCHKTGVPWRSVICLMGSPAASPYAKQALMIPQKVATSRPRFRLNSLMAARFCSSDNSRSFEIPAAPANAIPVKQIATPDRITIPEWVPSTCLANSPRKIGGSSVPKAAVYPIPGPVARHGGGARGHGEQVVGQGEGQQPRHKDPTEHAAGQPVGLPSPQFHASIAEVETGGGQASQPVEEHAQHGVCGHRLAPGGAMLRGIG